MKNLTAILFAAAVMAGAVWGGPAAGRTLVLDVTQPDNVWSTTVTRGEAFYIQANLYNRGSVYTNNDLTGYIWYASNATAAAGAILQSTTNSAGYVWFWMSTSNSLGLSTNDTFPTSYFAQVVLTNATVKYDWRQGKFTVRDGGGLSGVGAATAFTVINWDAINGVGTMPGTLSTANVQSIVNTMASTGTYHNADELGGLAASGITNTGIWASNSIPVISNALNTATGALHGADAALSNTVNTATNAIVSGDLASTNYTDSRVAAATQTIAGASVAGAVPSATTAGTATNWTGAQAMSNDLCGTVIPTSRVAYAASAGTAATATNLQAGTFSATMNESALALTLGASGDEAFFLFDLTNDMPRLVFGETGGYWWSLASDGGYADTFYMTNASGAYTYIFGSGGNVVTTGVKIAAATNADYAASAGTAATATGLVDNAVITVAPPTASNSPVDYATFSSALVGNFVSFLTTNRVNASTNAMLPTVPSSSSVTSRQVTAVGQYYITWHATNRTFRQLQGGAAEVELWGCENTPGSLTHKPELYIYVTNTEELIEFGENVASQTVAAGSTLTKQTFSVPYGPFVTNVDCQFVLRLKVTTISGTPTVQIGCGGTTPSHFSIDVPNSSLVPDNAVNAYNLGDLPAASYVTNGQKIAASTNADYATSAGTAGSASNLIQASGSMTNIFVYPFYSVGSAATSLWAWVNEATTITQVWCQADVANSCTATLYSLAVHTNNIAAGTVITNIVVTTTNSQKDCSYTIPANGALLISFGAGYAGATQGNVRCKGIGP